MKWKDLFKPKPSPIKWGFEGKELKNNEIYHVSGRLLSSPGFIHTIHCSKISPYSQTPQTDSELHQQVLEFIFLNERRETVRGAALAVYLYPPNFWIRIEAKPGVGETEILLERGICLRYQGFSSVAIAQGVCNFLAAMAERETHNIYPVLVKGDFTACHFWHLSIVTYYCRSVLKNGA